MTRTISALYDTRAEAEGARKRLIDMDIPATSISLIDQDAAAVPPAASTTSAAAGVVAPPAPAAGAGELPGAVIPPTEPTTPAAAGTRSADPVTAPAPERTAAAPPPSEHPGFWARLRHMFPERDRRAYEEGVHRGGTLLTATVSDVICDRAIAALEETHPVDLQQRQDEWLKAGWTPDQPAAVATAPAPTAARTPMSPAEMRAGDGQEQVIPVADESLRVGKRETSRGSVRVHSYVVEEPTQESVRLRDERVDVERRPVTGASAAEASDALKEHTVEMRETAEEPVVEKEPRVKEEVVVRKRAGEHVEQVKDTVRRTKVDVERTPGASTGNPPKVERTPRRPEDRPNR